MELMDLLILAIIALALTVIVFAAIYIQQYHFHFNLRENIHQYQMKYFNDWFEYLYKDAPTPPPFKEQYEQRGAIQIFFAYSRNGITPHIETRISHFLSENYHAYYMKELKSVRWAQRVNALKEISTFKIDGFSGIFSEKQIENFSHEERVLYFTYLSHFDKERFKSLFFTSKAINEFESKMIFNYLDDDTLLGFGNQFDTMPGKLKNAYLDIIPNVWDQRIVEWLEQLISHDELEVRIRALKGIVKIGYIVDERKYIPLFTAEAWQLRMFACRIAPLVGEYFLKEMKQCLNDEVKIVRSEAQFQINRLEIYYMRYSV